MSRIITKELAQKIAKKLGAEVVTEGAHDMVYIYHDGLLITSFGIRRGSKKDLGHDHVPAAIHLTPGKAKRLGQCSLSKQQWLEEMRSKNLLPREPQ